MGRAVSFIIASLTLFISASAFAQTNSWINQTSGKWEDASSWSLGAPPGAGQSVLVANHGWKAVAIDNNTAANFPQSMSINALTVISPGTDTVNTVLLNYAGLQTPLTIASNIDIGKDTAMVILESAIQMPSGYFSVGGTVTEDASSQVSAGYLLVASGGAYGLTNGTFSTSNSGWESVDGQFAQADGSNFCGSMLVDGQYDLSGGQLVIPAPGGPGGGLMVFGNFNQSGGSLDSALEVGVSGNGGGTFQLSGGILRTVYLGLPANPQTGSDTTPDSSYMVQTGGTNVTSSMEVGQDYGFGDPAFGNGSYLMTNGVMESSLLSIRGAGNFYQEGGTHINASMILYQSEFMDPVSRTNYFVPGHYYLGGGTFTSDSLTELGGAFSQASGSSEITSLQINDGTYSLNGGQLTASNIDLSNGANFLQSGGTITQSGTLTMGDANLAAGAGPQQYGDLQLNTNSTLTLVPGNCTLHFANSSGLAWPSTALLTINNWNGSLSGGGSQQIFFGNDSTGLTPQQLSQVQFNNPAGLAPGTYPAKILSNGELVPDAGSSGGTSGVVNSWINQNGGNWDDAASWSLGVPPDSSQSVFFTNYFWKAITIDSSTLANAPGSLTVSNLIMGGAPTGAETTKNTLLMNYVGAGNPLTVGASTNTPGSLIVGTNSYFVMSSSGLIVNNLLGPTNQHLGEFEIDGSFAQNDNSEVVANFLDVTNTGTYSMTNGTLYVGTQFINGTFNHDGGLNLGTVDMESTNSDYELFDGLVQGKVIVRGGTFNQSGGTNSATLVTGFRGLYNLKGGVLMPGDLVVGSPAQNYLEFPGGMIQQTGGTNIAGNITITNGFYVLDGGTLEASSLMISTNAGLGNLYIGEFDQYGGYQTNGAITMYGGTNDYRGVTNRVAAKYNLYNGLLQTPIITTEVGDFGQGGGTNNVGTLSMDDSIYALGGGLFAADQINLTAGSQFWHMGGSVGGMLNVTMANGDWAEWTTGAQLGQLQLASGNSFLGLPSNNSCVLQFADSSGVSWAGDATLTIRFWSGSLSGGGSQQVLFGTTASGLTAQQLSQVQFSNPGGLPAGTYAARILASGEVVPDASSSSSGPVNSWINSGSGNWDQSSNWSLGVLPNSSQSVLIANAGSKTVSINSSTPANFPGSMTVSNLFVVGSTNTENTLLLNNFGTNVPLTVLNSLMLQNGGQVQNLNSGLIVQNGTFMITNSDMIQDGGFVRATNGQTFISGSQYYLTNGDFEAGTVWLGYPVPAHFNQYGGSVRIADLGFGSYLGSTNQQGYSLYGGMLDLPGGMLLLGEYPGVSYFQAGGTNYTAQVTLEPDYGGREPDFTLNGGLLADSGFQLMAGYRTPVGATQNGGWHVITNTLIIQGSSPNGTSTDPATYNLNGGTLSAGFIELNANEGDSLFVQSNGTTFAGAVFAHSTGYYSSLNTHIVLEGGTLACSNFTDIDGGGTFNQTGGSLVVSNLLDFSGARDLGFGQKIYGKYTFTSGTIAAGDINIAADWFIGDGTSNRISNPGTFALSHNLTISNAVEQLGHFALPSSATINLVGSASQLSFANSTSEPWTNGATLVIANWNGSSSGGGTEQLKFGTDQSGLTAAQLNQVRFLISSNLYSAKILNTGEVVPDQVVQPTVTYSQQGNQLSMSWPPGTTLQTATSPTGPWTNVTDPRTYNGIPNPPYTIDTTSDSHRYFRVSP